MKHRALYEALHPDTSPARPPGEAEDIEHRRVLVEALNPEPQAPAEPPTSGDAEAERQAEVEAEHRQTVLTCLGRSVNDDEGGHHGEDDDGNG